MAKDTWFKTLTRVGFTEKSWRVTHCGFMTAQRQELKLDEVYLVGAEVNEHKEFIAEADGENVKEPRAMPCPKLVLTDPMMDQMFPVASSIHPMSIKNDPNEMTCWYRQLGQTFGCVVQNSEFGK